MHLKLLYPLLIIIIIINQLRAQVLI